MTRKRFLILKVGSSLPAVAERRGDYEDFIVSGLGVTPNEVYVIDPRDGMALPKPKAVRGVIITGSSAMVSHREDWSERTAAWLPSIVQAGTPLLGICYGHQLLAHALGGQVEKNPRGRIIGTVQVQLADAAKKDELFGDMDAELTMQATHVESALTLPSGAQVLGSSEREPHEAFRVGARAWGVQFHPEFDADIVRDYISARRDIIKTEGQDPDALIAATTDSTHGRALLRKFAQLG